MSALLQLRGTTGVKADGKRELIWGNILCLKSASPQLGSKKEASMPCKFSCLTGRLTGPLRWSTITLLLRLSVTNVRASEPSKNPLAKMSVCVHQWCGGSSSSTTGGQDGCHSCTPEHHSAAGGPPVLTHSCQLKVSRIGQAAILPYGALQHVPPLRRCGTSHDCCRRQWPVVANQR